MKNKIPLPKVINSSNTVKKLTDDTALVIRSRLNLAYKLRVKMLNLKLKPMIRIIMSRFVSMTGVIIAELTFRT